MKIAFIGQKGIPATSGAVEKYVENLATRLNEMGHDVFIYTRNNYTEKSLASYNGINLIHIPNIRSKNLETISYTFLSTIHALFQKYDVIHYQSIGPASLSFIPKFFKRKTLVISTFHSRDYLGKKRGEFAKRYLRFGEKMACKFSDKTIAISKNIRNYVFSKYKIKTVYIPNGAQTEYNCQTQALDRWKLKDKKYIFCIGKVIKNKGIKNLIKAFKNMEDTNKLPNNMKLVIVMDDSSKQIDEFQKISSHRKSIIFTHNQTRATLEQLFSHSYLFVQPSESEGFPISLLEAMSYKVAPLVSDEPENMEIIGKCGFSFRAGNGEDLENKLAYLLNKYSDVERMGRLSKERIQKEYSWDSIARKTLRVYELNQKFSKKIVLRKISAENKSYV